MGMSVNTNVGAMAALQSLSETNRGLATTQSRINTGLDVASAKDDSAKYTIAQKLRGDMGELKAVGSSLSRAKSTTDVAIAGAEQVSDLLNQMKAKAKEASDTGIDANSRTAIAKDLTALKEQVNTIIDSSGFNGTNLLKTDTGTTGKVSALQSMGSTSTTGTLEVANQDFTTKSTTALGAAGAAITLADGAAADTLKGLIDTFASEVSTSLSSLGSASRKIDGQMQFNSKLSDVIEAGVGNLVDADLAKESAKLQALQVKQQLGVQALSIANQAPQSITSLFR
ncbi:flagellin [Sphingomonas sp. OV641]|uniref:flagellin N-terminal helical domain-containing protein n=1 Tax=Sphingomonas sp. OV641 TaxID=1881068 RepID=UPI0008B73289|nr:flagellin [Sphingomonas sp. OV641]SEI77416.1 flagellin [Sphingomonas sp. OV641]